LSEVAETTTDRVAPPLVEKYTSVVLVNLSYPVKVGMVKRKMMANVLANTFNSYFIL